MSGRLHYVQEAQARSTRAHAVSIIEERWGSPASCPFSELLRFEAGAFTRPSIPCMAFNLKKVLKALLLSSSQPLAIKDIQAAFTRFHEQAEALAMDDASKEESPRPEASTAPPREGDGAAEETVAASTPRAIEAEEAVEVPIESIQDPELYSDVPSLITGTQIREAMDQIAADF